MAKKSKLEISASELLETGDAAGRDRKYKTAIKFYKQYLQLEPADTGVMKKIGAQFEKMNEICYAEEWYTKAVKIDNQVSSFLKLADVQNKALDHNSALQSIRRALEIDPDNEKAHELNVFTIGEFNNAPQLKLAAERLLAINPENVDGLSYLGKALTKDQDFEGAQKALDRALELDPFCAYAHLFSGMLKIDQLQIDAGLKKLNDAYAIYARSKNKSQMDYISGVYFHYKSSSSTSKRCSAFGGTSVEEQIAVLASCGLKFKEGFSCEEFLARSKNKRSRFEIEDPFNALLLALSADEALLNAETFDDECIEQKGDYKRFAEMFKRLSLDAFPLEDCDDIVDWGENDEAKPTLSLSFSLYGESYKWRPRVKDDWLDWNILRKLGKLAVSKNCGVTFIAPHNGSLVVCLPSALIDRFSEKTLIEFDAFTN